PRKSCDAAGLQVKHANLMRSRVGEVELIAIELEVPRRCERGFAPGLRSSQRPAAMCGARERRHRTARNLDSPNCMIFRIRDVDRIVRCGQSLRMIEARTVPGS